MKKVIRLSESDLIKLVKKVLSESDSGNLKPDSFPEYEYREVYIQTVDKKSEIQQLVFLKITKTLKMIQK